MGWITGLYRASPDPIPTRSRRTPPGVANREPGRGLQRLDSGGLPGAAGLLHKGLQLLRCGLGQRASQLAQRVQRVEQVRGCQDLLPHHAGADNVAGKLAGALLLWHGAHSLQA